MKCSLGISNFLEEISSLSYFVFLYFSALITEEVFLISSFYSLELCIGAQYATGDQWRKNSRKNKGMEPKQKQYPVLDVMVIEARSDAVKSNIA